MDVPAKVESTEAPTDTRGRRTFVGRVLQGLGAVGLLARFRGRADADVPAPAVPQAPPAASLRPPSDPVLGTDLPPTFLQALVGREFRGCRVERAVAPHLGGAAIVLRDAHGRFQIDVLARGSEAGVAETERYALYLANRGDGRGTTHEPHGLALMDIAGWLRAREATEAPLPLVTLAERHRAHPRGNFLLP